MVDLQLLERAYLDRSRTIHPDYHLSGPDAELSASQELSALLNEAYNTLRDSFTRADYLLTLEGGPSTAEHKQLPPDFLGEMLEAREEVENARGNPTEISRLEARFDERYNGFLRQIEEKFRQYEGLSPEDPRRANLRTAIRGLLNAAKYVRGLLRDLHSD